jgi:catechol 2,3-dioxygenase-like lactoylglutathione lyase family enzyme
MQIFGLHHVQLAISSAGEAAAREFYSGLLGLAEVAKPEHLAVRGLGLVQKR